MIRPPVEYARTSDDVTIAYSRFGDGPLTLVCISPLISQLEVAWEEPRFEQFMSRLGACARVLMFDRRGTGLSDHSTASGDQLALPCLAIDVEGVLDATETDRAVLCGFSLGSMVAVQFATDFPHRTAAVILYAGAARSTSAPDFPVGMDPGQVDEWADMVARAWGTGMMVEVDTPDVEADRRYREWAARLERHTSSPGMVAASLRRAALYDIRPYLPEIAVPALLLHRIHDRGVDVEQSRYMSRQIPGARYVELDGEDHSFFLGDQQAILDAIVAFLDDHVAAGQLAALVQEAERKSAYGYGWSSLTFPEREIAALAAAGLTNNEIATQLRMSRYTVDGRLRRVFAKLDVSTRVELATEYARLER